MALTPWALFGRIARHPTDSFYRRKVYLCPVGHTPTPPMRIVRDYSPAQTCASRYKYLVRCCDNPATGEGDALQPRNLSPSPAADLKTPGGV